MAEDAARRLAQMRRLEMQRRESRARGNREQEAGSAPNQRPLFGQLVAAEQEHAGDQHEDREQVGRSAEQQERDIGEPRAGGAHAVRHDLVAARHAERRVSRAVAQESEQENHAQARQHPKRRFAKPFDARHEKGLEPVLALALFKLRGSYAS